MTEKDSSGEEIQSEPDWKPVSLYGIVGFFTQAGIGDMAFGGYLKVIQEDGSAVGELIDTYGPSRTFGSLKDNKLELTKEYTLRRKERPDKTFEYVLERVNGNFFEGHFSSPALPGLEFAVQLWLFEAMQNAYDVATGPPHPIEKAEKLYRS